MAMWSDDESRDDRIDRAIDAVAQRMTDGAPDAGFKARVLARISDDRSPHRSRQLAWILSPLAAAAIVLLILFMRLGKESHHGVETSPPQPPVVARTERERSEPRPQQSTPPARANINRARARDMRKSVVPPSEIDALAPPPLEVDSIALSEIEPAGSIDIQRLETITPIALAPIGEGDRQ